MKALRIVGVAIAAIAAIALPSASSATLQPRTCFAEEFGWVA
jgi:hypothetical protein